MRLRDGLPVSSPSLLELQIDAITPGFSVMLGVSGLLAAWQPHS